MPRATTEDKKKARPLDFQELESLRLFSRQVLQDQVSSLKYFGYDVGYKHYKSKEDKISISSTATCVLSLVATGSWKADKTQTKKLLSALISKKTRDRKSVV